MADMISKTHSNAILNLRRQLHIAKIIAMKKLSLEMYPQLVILNSKLGLFGPDETGLYKGLDAGKEMIEALASATRAVMQEHRSRASEIGVAIDETTDRSVKSQMIIIYKYYCSGIEQLPNGKAQAVMTALLTAPPTLNKVHISVTKKLHFLAPMALESWLEHQRRSLKNQSAKFKRNWLKLQYFFNNFEALARQYSFSATRR